MLGNNMRQYTDEKPLQPAKLEMLYQLEFEGDGPVYDR